MTIMVIKNTLFLVVLMMLSSSFSFVSCRKARQQQESIVQGVVQCQDCNQAWTPVVNAEVKIVCTGKKGNVGFYRAYSTDFNGYFYAPLKGGFFRYGHVDVGRSCTVRLLSSPDPLCGVFTNINGGVDGSPLRVSKSFSDGPYRKTVVYDAGPLVFRPAHC